MGRERCNGKEIQPLIVPGASPTASAPVCLTTAFAHQPGKEMQWKGFIRKNRMQNVPHQLEEIIRGIAVFLRPAVNALAQGVPFQATWQAPGPWQ